MNADFLKYVRHLSKQDRKSLSQKALKTCEEVGELAKVVLPYENAYATTHRFTERERILEEAVDTVLCALSVAYDLDFTDDEVYEMLVRKSEKWNQLQINEADVKYPLPFEIHITVDLESSKVPWLHEDRVYMFRQDCNTISVKPIVLDLQGRDGTLRMKDVMTSSHHFGTNASAYREAMRIREELRLKKYNVVRVKIETVPWHPAAPKVLASDMPQHCYFEAHIPVTVVPETKQTLREQLTPFLSRGYLHLSSNTFKKNEDGTEIVMLTLRHSDCVAHVFETHVKVLERFLAEHLWVVGKVHTEFAVYDTKVSHDNAWINAT